MKNEVILEQLSKDNYKYANLIKRDDIPDEWVDTASTIMEINEFGLEHNLTGHTYLARVDERYRLKLVLGLPGVFIQMFIVYERSTIL